MPELLLVGLGGFCGAMARYLLAGLFWRLSPLFPWGTFTVNVLGTMALGFLMTLATETLLISPALRVFLAIGFLGSFTTFSTFAYETSALLDDGALVPALLNVVFSLLAGLCGVRLGAWLARSFF